MLECMASVEVEVRVCTAAAAAICSAFTLHRAVLFQCRVGFVMSDLLTLAGRASSPDALCGCGSLLSVLFRPICVWFGHDWSMVAALKALHTKFLQDEDPLVKSGLHIMQISSHFYYVEIWKFVCHGHICFRKYLRNYFSRLSYQMTLQWVTVFLQLKRGAAGYTFPFTTNVCKCWAVVRLKLETL